MLKMHGAIPPVPTQLPVIFNSSETLYLQINLFTNMMAQPEGLKKV
jgi:hypothetical protein